MDGRAEVGAAARPGGTREIPRRRAIIGAVLLMLLVIWFVLIIFVLDVVVADAVNLAAAVAWLAVAAWRSRKRREVHPSTWFALFLSITMPYQFLHDLAIEHRWPAGQLHELIVARWIVAVPALACLAIFGIVLIRKKRRAAYGGGDPSAYRTL